jgi:hypothetical protein
MQFGDGDSYTVTHAFLGFSRPTLDHVIPERRTSKILVGFQLGTYTGTRISSGAVVKAVLSTSPNGVGPLEEGVCR